MKLILSFISICLLTSCNFNSSTFDKAYYERITGMKFPGNIEVLESIDNAEFVTVTSFRIENSALNKFIKKNGLKKTDKKPRLMFAQSYLKKLKPQFVNLNSIYVIEGKNGHNVWTYIADLSTNMLYAEILYPDPGGRDW